MRSPALASLALAACLAACTPRAASPDADLVFASGTSFGECVGWCWRETVADGETARITLRDYDPATPDSVLSYPLDPARWARLTDALDLRALQAADTVYGCPDCADGGAEWIEVRWEGYRKRVTFEHGATVEGLEPLIEAARALR